MAEVVMKVCNRCGEEKDIKWWFRINDGKRSNICKVCEGRYKDRDKFVLSIEFRIKAEDLRLKGMKECLDCHEIKPTSEYGKGNRTICLCCNNRRSRERYNKTKDLVAKRRRETREEEPDRFIIYGKKYYEGHRDEVLLKTNEYKRTHREQRREYDNLLEVKLANKIRKRIKKAIKTGYRLGKFEEFVGCSTSELKDYIETKFYINHETGEAMAWDNYGFYGWHLDHIIPLSSFDLTDPKQLKKACHYTNLQPLWAKDNLQKGSKLDWRRK